MRTPQQAHQFIDADHEEQHARKRIERLAQKLKLDMAVGEARAAAAGADTQVALRCR